MAATSLDRAIKEVKEHLEINRDWDDDDGPNDDDAIDYLMDECGRDPGGGCSMAGTEYCDWDCPFS